MKLRRLALLLFWLPLALALAWLWFNLPQVLSQVGQLLAHLRPWQLAALAGLNLALAVLFALRWHLLALNLGATTASSTRAAFGLWLRLALYRLAAFGVSFVTPGPQFGGEPLQVYLLQRREAAPPAAALASVTLDKLLELLSNYLFLLLCLAALLLWPGSALALPPGLASGNVWTLAGLAALLLWPALHLLGLSQGLRPLSSLGRALAAALPHLAGEGGNLAKVIRLVGAAEQQIGAFSRQRWRSLLGLINLSLLVWAAAVVEYWLTFAFLGLPLNFFQLIALATALRLSLWTPVPGAVGALEAGQLLTLNWLGLEPAYGVGALLLLRTRDFVFAGAGLALGWWLIRSDR
jgi:glycosyltransferase 2 family protein